MNDMPPAVESGPSESVPVSTGLDEKSSLLDWILRFCLENKLVVFLAVIAILGAGVIVAPFDWELTGLPRNPVPVDAIPDIGENQQIVFTEWMGRSPQDVQDQISYPLTQALLGIPGVKTIRSNSMFGFSSLYIIFEEQIDFYWSRSRVLEKLSSLPSGTLPEGVQPTLGPDATGLGQIFWYTLEGRDPDGEPIGGWDLHELRTVQDWYVRYGLMAAGGISEVASVGGFVQEYQIDVDPDAMRAAQVQLHEVFMAVRQTNVDVGARTIEINQAEFVVRGLGFIEQIEDIEKTVIKVNENVPITVKDIGKVTLGPALRRGVLDKAGAEAVGGVAVVRYGFNPLAAIKNVKLKIEELAPGLPTKAIIDYDHVAREKVVEFAAEQGFVAFDGNTPNHSAWIKWLRETPRDGWPEWINTSQVTVVPFYDRTGLIHETLGTLNTALTEEILVTLIVVIVSLLHLRSSILIGSLLPLAVLICFVAMKLFGVDANVVALSGIAIAIGTMVDMGIILNENILKQLDEAEPEEDRLEVILRAAREVGSAVLTAVLTTIISFLPVFTMTEAEGKLFKPLAFTKSFALLASILVALTIIPPMAHLFYSNGRGTKWLKKLGAAVLVALGIPAAFWVAWWAAAILVVLGLFQFVEGSLPPGWRRLGPWLGSGAAVLFVGVLLSEHWMPLGPAQGSIKNLLFVGLLIGGLLAFFQIFERWLYRPILRFCLSYKLLFLVVPLAVVLAGLAIWIGPAVVFGMIPAKFDKQTLTTEEQAELPALDRLKYQLSKLRRKKWEQKWNDQEIRESSLAVKAKWTLAKSWDGLGKEFMPPLDEGSYLYMPTTMPHASIGESLDVLQKQDQLIASIPEIESVVGKIGRVESSLDPAPISMVETIINYKPEYILDEHGHRARFRYDEEKQDYSRDDNGKLIPDPQGRPFRQWRETIHNAHEIWLEIEKIAAVPGSTSAPELQPIAARIVMLQSGMRAPMGVKVKGPDLETIEQVALQIERLLKEVNGVKQDAVIADRIVGKPYLEIDIDRDAISRYGLKIQQVQDVIETAIGGRTVTTTVQGRERYPVRIRYPRELRDQIESLHRVLVAAADGSQIPLIQLANFRYVRGPQSIKSEDTFLVGYVLFDKLADRAEVDVVEAAQRYLEEKQAAGELILPPGVSYTFAGSYENQIRSQKTLAVVLPFALFLIFVILYLQFRSTMTTLIVFSGIAVAWAGGFMMIWLYNQPWFLNFDLFETNMRTLFGVHPINMSVAIWVGFLALFGIATDDGVVIATYLKQTFGRRKITTTKDARIATLEAGIRRVRPCLMTTATTILALIPVLTSTGRGSDIMVPMAIPSFGGMLIAIMTMFVVPVLFCTVKELELKLGVKDPLFAENVEQ